MYCYAIRNFWKRKKDKRIRLKRAWNSDKKLIIVPLSLHLECSVLGVEGEAELNLAAVVSHDEAILPLLENYGVIDDVFSALSQS